MSESRSTQPQAHPLKTTLADFVAGLRTMEQNLITKPGVLQYVSEAKLRIEALRPYVFWNEHSYTRNLVYRDEIFEVMTICWRPGQKTPIHTHNGQLGWMIVVQGEILTHQYRYVRCSSPENQNVLGIDCLAGGNQVELERLDTISCADDGRVVTVDKLQTIHQIENAEEARSGCVSLHIYSKPFDSCVAFDLEGHRCFRRSLKYYSADGRVLSSSP
jgi:cysteine dioxygenase